VLSNFLQVEKESPKSQSSKLHSQYALALECLIAVIKMMDANPSFFNRFIIIITLMFFQTCMTLFFSPNDLIYMTHCYRAKHNDIFLTSFVFHRRRKNITVRDDMESKEFLVELLPST